MLKRNKPMGDIIEKHERLLVLFRLQLWHEFVEGAVDGFNAVHLWFGDEAAVGADHVRGAEDDEVVEWVGVAYDKVRVFAGFEGAGKGADAQDVGVDLGGGVKGKGRADV